MDLVKYGKEGVEESSCSCRVPYSVSHADLHEIMISRMELNLVDALSVAIELVQRWWMSIGLVTLFEPMEHAQFCAHVVDLSSSFFGEKVTQDRIILVQIVVFKRWNLICHLMRELLSEWSTWWLERSLR